MIEVYETIGYLVLGFLSVMWLTKIAKCILRDYFAASFVESGHIFKSMSDGNTPELVAEQAYALADAMMKAREA